MILVDVFSSYLFVEPLTNLRAETVAKALLKTVQGSYRCPKLLLTDKGSEWIGSAMQHMLKRLGIKHECDTITLNKSTPAESSINVIKK